MRSVIVLLALAGSAAAHPILVEPDPPKLIEWRDTPALLEWSTWIGGGFGVQSSRSNVIARGTTPDAELGTTWTFSAGAELTLPLAGSVRLGPWVGVHDLEPMVGGELEFTARPRSLDLFFYRGEGVVTVRAGGGFDRGTIALAYGYRCPWKLWGPYTETSRYEIGARIVIDATRAYDDPKDWSATIGLEVEPVGAIRYLFGIRDWY
ncbi:MAG: hypothetical protein QM831_11380 [Kofleriaceae bacterium]